MKRELKKRMLQLLLLLPMLAMVGCTAFELTSTPEADIYENGELLGTTPLTFELVSGARTFTLKKFGYVEQEVVVSALDPRKIKIEMQWVGKTRIDSLPRGARVIDLETNEELGTTPCALHLDKETRVKVSLEGFEAVEQDLTPNEKHVVELEPIKGFDATAYKDVMFNSEQGAVDIYDLIAGRRIGTTPCRLQVKAGSELEYHLAGFKSKRELVSRMIPYRVKIELEPITHVLIDGTAGAEVYRAGGLEMLGNLPFSVKVEGDVLYEIKKEGYYPKTVAISKTSPESLEVLLKEIPYKTIVTDPPGADIYRLGGLEKIGTTPYRTVVENERVFEVKKEGYQKSTVGLGPDSPVQMNIPLAPEKKEKLDAAAIGELDNMKIEVF